MRDSRQRTEVEGAPRAFLFAQSPLATRHNLTRPLHSPDFFPRADGFSSGGARLVTLFCGLPRSTSKDHRTFSAGIRDFARVRFQWAAFFKRCDSSRSSDFCAGQTTSLVYPLPFLERIQVAHWDAKLATIRTATRSAPSVWELAQMSAHPVPAKPDSLLHLR